MIGQKFERLTVLARNGRKKNSTSALYDCKCDCGKLTQATAYDLKRGRVRSCGCFRRDVTWKVNKENHKLWRGCGKLSLTHFNRVKLGASLRKFEFTITIEDCWNQYLLQDGKCALTGWDIPFLPSRQGNIASIDRIDNTLGYVIGNIQWVHKSINIMKSSHTQDEFIKMCRAVANHS